MYQELSYTTREEWLTLRQRGIGGSDAAAIMGLNQYKSPIDVFLEKTTPVTESADNAYTRWGKRLEAVIRDAFTEETGIAILTPQTMFQSVSHPFMLASVDGLGTDERGDLFILECKNTTRRDLWQGEDVPLSYLIQLLHYLSVTGAKYGRFAVLANGHDFFITPPIHRDESVLASLIEKETFFWQEYVEKQTLPPITEAAADVEAASRLQSSDDVLLLPDTFEPLLEKREILRSRKSEIERDQEQIDLQVKAALGTHGCGMCKDYVVNWRSVDRTVFQTKLFQQQHPDLYSQFTTQSTSRRFEVRKEL